MYFQTFLPYFICLFTVYLTTLSVAQTTVLNIIIDNTELEMIWKKAVVASLVGPSLQLSEGTEGNQGKLRSG
jgi:hypothetical protein